MSIIIRFHILFIFTKNLKQFIKQLVFLHSSDTILLAGFFQSFLTVIFLSITSNLFSGISPNIQFLQMKGLMPAKSRGSYQNRTSQRR